MKKLQQYEFYDVYLPSYKDFQKAMMSNLALAYQKKEMYKISTRYDEAVIINNHR